MVPEGVQHFPGWGSNFSLGFHMLILIERDFLWGGGGGGGGGG